MTEQERAVRDAYFIEARLHWDKWHHPDDGMRPPDPTRRYTVLDGGTDSRGATHKPLWERIVKFAWKHDIDPVLLVQSVFANHTDSKMPLPSMFTSLAALESVKEQTVGRFIDVQNEFKTFRNAANRRKWELEQTMSAPLPVIWRLVIADPQLEHGPLYRFCLAIELNQLDLAAGYRFGALKEYMHCPDEFDGVMGKYIPDDFKQEGRRLRERLKHG